MYWLGLEDLDQWNVLRLKLANLSTELCAGFINGKADNEIFKKAFSKLSDSDIEKWFKISFKSIKSAVINEKSYDSKIAQENFRIGLSRVFEVVGNKDTEKTLDILQHSATKSPDDNCWASKKIHEGAKLLPEKQRLEFLKALASAG